MKLSYRNLPHEYTPPSVELIEGKSMGKYPGALRRVTRLPIVSFRGVSQLSRYRSLDATQYS